MMSAEKVCITCRHKSVKVTPESEDLYGEGPSAPKGKAIDLREWGMIDWEDDMDYEAQFNLLEKYKRELEQKICSQRNTINSKNCISAPPSVVSRQESVPTVPMDKLPDMQPATVMHPKSAIARTMLKAGKRISKKGKPSPSSSSSTDSDPSSSSSSESSDSSSSSAHKSG